ncbi:MAG: hypothetical protein GF411_02800 [Candidatus Lokiarchaeota archaeon]|nr:hypothetical protein [Candidatus Lokiarchaeota archaeon]
MARLYLIESDIYPHDVEDCLQCCTDSLDIAALDMQYQIRCPNCGVCGESCRTVEEAVQKWNKMCNENMRLRKVIEDTAQVLTEDLACRPADECPDLSAYADGHCDLVVLARNWIRMRSGKQ